MKKLLFVLTFIILYFPAFSQEKNPLIVKNDFKNQKKWVDSIYDGMSLEEKIGQLFMADIFSNDPIEKIDKIKNLISAQMTPNMHLGWVFCTNSF